MKNIEITGEMIASRIRECMNDEWLYEYDPDRCCFFVEVKLSEKANLQFSIYISMSAYVVYYEFPLRVDLNNRKQVRDVAEFVCRVNDGLRNGNFEFGFGDGKIYYKTYTNCIGQLPSKAIIKESLMMPYVMLSHYAAAIASVIRGEKLPAEALALADCCFDEPGEDAENAADEQSDDAPEDEDKAKFCEALDILIN